MSKKIDVIIPAYKAQKTILRTLASIAEQTILDDVEVTIVNDCCPNGDYSEVVKMYSPYMNIREIKMDKNGGPGLARQYGIDHTENPYFTCIDADDTFVGAIALETLRVGMEKSDVIKCVSGTFIQLGDDLQHLVPHREDMVWMFGKLYRRDFIEHYKIHFNGTRANEDTGFNTWVKLLCNNPNEQILFINEVVYYWHNKKDSITRINDGQYQFDQCMCGWTDNMIYAVKNVKKVRPFDGNVNQWIAHVMIQLYYYIIECHARKPVFEDQEWEYVKKFYHACYKRIEEDMTDEAFSQVYSMTSMGSWNSPAMMGVIPHIGIREFMDKLKAEEYDPDHIYDVWAKIPKELVENNEKCGVCPKGYTKRPKKKEDKDVKLVSKDLGKKDS